MRYPAAAECPLHAQTVDRFGPGRSRPLLALSSKGCDAPLPCRNYICQSLTCAGTSMQPFRLSGRNGDCAARLICEARGARETQPTSSTTRRSSPPTLKEAHAHHAKQSSGKQLRLRELGRNSQNDRSNSLSIKWLFGRTERLERVDSAVERPLIPTCPVHPLLAGKRPTAFPSNFSVADVHGRGGRGISATG
jgi:hypothetical protein